MSYKNGEYYWIKARQGDRWEIGQYRENHSTDAPLAQRFELCGGPWGIAIDRVFKIWPGAIPPPKEEEEG